MKKSFITLLLLAAGCGHDESPKPLTPVMVAGTSRRIGTEPQSAVDQPGMLAVQQGSRVRSAETDEPRTPIGPGVERVSPTVQENVKVPGQSALERAATQTTARTASTTSRPAASGQYMTI